MRLMYRSASVCLVLLSAGAVYAQDGTATGTFTVNGKPTKLAYAYAMAEPDSFDKSKEAVRVVLSDVKLTPEQLDGPFGLQGLMKANQVHAVVAEISASKQIATTMLYDKAFAMDSVSVAGTNNKFEGTVDPKSIGGKLFTAKAATVNKASYEYSVTFTAPIQRKAAAAKSSSGARTPDQDAALKAAQAYMKAARAGDVAGLKAAVVADAAADLDGAQGKEIIEMLKAMVPANPTVGPIEITGDTAVIKFEEKEKNGSSTSTLRLKKVNGAWKVNPKG